MEPVIRVANLVQTSGRKPVLNNLSFEVAAGECFGVFGTRGSGKTTLLHILAGIDRFRSGEVSVLGYDVRKSGGFKNELGLVTQSRSLFLDLTAMENLDFFAALKNVPAGNIYPAIRNLELADYLDNQAGELDAGVFQRLSLACAMLNSPRLLIADELIKDIDLDSRRLLLKTISGFISGGGACVWAFSDIGCCSYMSRVAWLERGVMNILTPEQAAREWEQRVSHTEEDNSCKPGEDDA